MTTFVQGIPLKVQCKTSILFTFLLLLTFLLTTLSGCHETQLQALPIPDAAVRLSKLGFPLNLEIESEQASTSGTQFLLLIIPFGKVRLPEPKQYLEKISYTELALSGFSAQRAKKNNSPTLKISMKELSTTAYDFFFFRKVVGRAHLAYSLTSSNGRVLLEMDSNESTSEYRRFGFSSELNKALQQVVRLSLKPILTEMKRLCLGGKRCK